MSAPSGQRGPGVPPGDLSLAELLDRLVGRGVALQGDVVLSVAGVDLVWLGLKAVLAGADLAPPRAGTDLTGRAGPGRAQAAQTARTRPSGTAPRQGIRGAPPAREHPLPRAGRLSVDGERVEEGLVRLVLSVVELLRQLMEGQALRRMDSGALSEDQLEALGVALMRLSERMDDLKEFFGLSDDDLELQLTGARELT